MECLLQLGRFKNTPTIIQNPGQGDRWTYGNNKGTPEVPIVRSRRLKFATPFDRHFPGIAPYMSTKRPDYVLPVWRIYRKDTTYMLSTLHMAPCPSCAVWQELRAFCWPVRGWGYDEFIGVKASMDEAEVAEHTEEVNSMQCNKCMYKQLGSAALGQRLSAFMRERLKTECHDVLRMLSGGWRNLSYSTNKPHHGYNFDMKGLLASLEAAEKQFTKIKHNGGRSELDLEAEDLEDNLALMHRRRQE